MKIYSCNNSGEYQINKLKEYGMGVMINTHPSIGFVKSFLSKKDKIKGIPLCLDNGAFGTFSKGLGFPFNEFAFLQTLNEVILHKLPLEFIVIPDRVGHPDSLVFSMSWIDRLTSDNLALVIQDGMEPCEQMEHSRVSTLFLGGTVEWKFSHGVAKKWCDYAHSTGRKFHFGQVGTLERLRYAEEIGADSCDSTNFIRNDSWSVIDQFRDKSQCEMF